MNEKTYFIPAINCMHCVHTIKSELMEIPGVLSVEGDVEMKKIAVKFEAPATEKAIEDLLVEINYPPKE